MIGVVRLRGGEGRWWAGNGRGGVVWGGVGALVWIGAWSGAGVGPAGALVFGLARVVVGHGPWSGLNLGLARPWSGLGLVRAGPGSGPGLGQGFGHARAWVPALIHISQPPRPY